MKPITVHFYRASECLGGNGNKIDYQRMASVQPIGSFKARAGAVFKMHLDELGLSISRSFPDLEGRTLDVELEFRGNEGKPKLPVLVALDQGREVARREILVSTLDVGPFLPILLKRRPELKDTDLYFTISPTE